MDRTRHLVAGCHLYQHPDGGWRMYGPDDSIMRVGGDPQLLAAAQPVLHGAPTQAPPDARVLAAFDQRGLLADAGPDPTGSIDPATRVHLDGTGPVAALVAHLLAGTVTLTTGTVTEDDVAGSTFVIACAPWLPDQRWCEVDGWCVAHATPWHMCHGEGDRFYLGPCYLPGRTASYADCRGRRLAAAPAPDELRGYWAFLESNQPQPAPAVPAGVAAVLAGLIVTDTLAHLAGQAPPSAGRQLAFHPGRGELASHPVLPLPVLQD